MPALALNGLLRLGMLVTVTLPPVAYAQDSIEETRAGFPTRVSQGALVIGTVPAGSQVEYTGRVLRVNDK
ncbi:MAG TPA: M23 family peptidase, partial [Xylella taiwanensis]